MKSLSKQDRKTLKLLVQIGNEASVGKICQQCGRGFPKARGEPRLCFKCNEAAE